jgi:hypothetical protein
MPNQWRQFLEAGNEQLATQTPHLSVTPREVAASETAGLIRQGTLRALLLLTEQPISREEAKECAAQVAQLRRSLTQAENAFRRRAGEPL